MPPTYQLRELGTQAQSMSRNCNSERMAMTMQYVAIGCMIIMAGVAASQVLILTKLGATGVAPGDFGVTKGFWLRPAVPQPA